ncbi:MAG: protein kinase family protein [Dermatophilaceae bacterium]
MHGVGPGTILGGRYSLRGRLSQSRDLERWSAHDTTLERAITLTIVDADHPNRAGILDAARRAAGVEDTRLVRILDVGTQDGNSYFVEEALVGAESLASILARGALPSEEARRIVGEVASALETARQRGLHHLRLTPHRVLRAHDGSIKVTGVAVAVAIEGPDREPDPAAASRQDAVSVVAVAYAALTSRWPLDERVPGIEPAPRVVGGVAAPSEIAAGVPGDLDALCRMTLNEDTGPLTPGDFASQIAPWSRERVHRVTVEQTVVLDLADPGNDVITYKVPAHVVTSADRSSDATLPADSPEPEAGHRAQEETIAAAAAATKAVDNAVAEAGAVVGAVVGRVGSFARAAADKAAAVATALTDTDLDDERMSLREALSTHSQNAEPPVPMLPAWSTQPPSRDQSKVVVIIVATFVALSLLVGYCGFRGIGEGVNAPVSAPKPTVKATAPPAATTPTTPTQATATAGQPLAILSATGFDPEGDGQEKNTQAPRVYDGNLATAWTSEGYGSADFGGLGKKGLGVRLDLGQPTSVNQVTIDLGNGPVDVTVYAATADSLEGATVIGSAKGATGQVQLKATEAMPQTQYVIVWFTKLAPDGGRFRASISEIALS